MRSDNTRVAAGGSDVVDVNTLLPRKNGKTVMWVSEIATPNAQPAREILKIY